MFDYLLEKHNIRIRPSNDTKWYQTIINYLKGKSKIDKEEEEDKAFIKKLIDPKKVFTYKFITL